MKQQAAARQKAPSLPLLTTSMALDWASRLVASMAGVSSHEAL